MPKRYEQFFDEQKGKARAAFEQANPKIWTELLNNPDAVSRTRQAHEWAKERINLIRREYEETKADRVGREALKIWEERSVPQLNYPAPNNALGQDTLANTAILAEARRRVRFEVEKEIANVESRRDQTISEITEQERISGMTQEERHEHLKGEVHKALETARTARTQARKLFNKERESLIEKAQEEGSENPTRDVSAAQYKVMTDIDRQEHKDVHAAFQKFGWDYEKQHVEFIKEFHEADHEHTSEPSHDHGDDHGHSHDG